jgi:hypothetical protein
MLVCLLDWCLWQLLLIVDYTVKLTQASIILLSWHLFVPSNNELQLMLPFSPGYIHSSALCSCDVGRGMACTGR